MLSRMDEPTVSPDEIRSKNRHFVLIHAEQMGGFFRLNRHRKDAETTLKLTSTEW